MAMTRDGRPIGRIPILVSNSGVPCISGIHTTRDAARRVGTAQSVAQSGCTARKNAHRSCLRRDGCEIARYYFSAPTMMVVVVVQKTPRILPSVANPRKAPRCSFLARVSVPLPERGTGEWLGAAAMQQTARSPARCRIRFNLAERLARSGRKIRCAPSHICV